jgi:DNA-binding MarR family transcriptional regulator
MVPGEVLRFHQRLMSRLMSDLSGLIQAHDLTPAQISTLFRLRSRDHTVTQIGSELGLTAPTASHIVDRLIARGLVERRPCPEDGRRRDVVLTSTGRQFLTAFDSGLTASLEGLLADLPAPDLDQLATALRTVLQGLESTPARAQDASPPSGGR